MSDQHERRHNLEYESAVALRYHGRRKAFLDTLARLGPMLSVVLGGTAFATLTAGMPSVAKWCALAVTIAGAFNLAFGLSDRARLHESLFQRWGMLRAELAAADDDDERELRRLEAKRALIDAESPWQLVALSALCENEEKEVRKDSSAVQIGWWQRALANFLTLPGWQPRK